MLPKIIDHIFCFILLRILLDISCLYLAAQHKQFMFLENPSSTGKREELPEVSNRLKTSPFERQKTF